MILEKKIMVYSFLKPHKEGVTHEYPTTKKITGFTYQAS